MGCCFGKPEQEQVVIRVRTASRIPPMKKGDSYGTLFNEEEETEFKNSDRDCKSKTTKPESPQKKTPQSPLKLFGGKKPRSPRTPQENVTENPFSPTNKKKLRRGYATKGGARQENPSTFAQGSPVLNRIKSGNTENQHHQPPSVWDKSDSSVWSAPPLSVDHKGSRESPGNDATMAASSVNDADKNTNGICTTEAKITGIPVKQGSTSSLSVLDIPSDKLSPKMTPDMKTDIDGALKDNDNNHAIDSKEQSVKTKKTGRKKLGSKLAKMLPGKKKKK